MFLSIGAIGYHIPVDVVVVVVGGDSVHSLLQFLLWPLLLFFILLGPARHKSNTRAALLRTLFGIIVSIGG